MADTLVEGGQTSYEVSCPWCGKRYDMTFIWRLNGKTRYQGEHHCVLPPLVDDRMLTTMVRWPNEDGSFPTPDQIDAGI